MQDVSFHLLYLVPALLIALFFNYAFSKPNPKYAGIHMAVGAVFGCFTTIVSLIAFVVIVATLTWQRHIPPEDRLAAYRWLYGDDHGRQSPTR